MGPKSTAKSCTRELEPSEANLEDSMDSVLATIEPLTTMSS